MCSHDYYIWYRTESETNFFPDLAMKSASPYFYIKSSILLALPLLPSSVLIFVIRNLRRIFMSSSFGMTKSIFLLDLWRLRHYQLKNGIFLISARLVLFMCFLIIQKRDWKPPKWMDSMSSTWQLQLEVIWLNSGSSSISSICTGSARMSLLTVSVGFLFIIYK